MWKELARIEVLEKAETNDEITPALGVRSSSGSSSSPQNRCDGARPKLSIIAPKIPYAPPASGATLENSV